MEQKSVYDVSYCVFIGYRGFATSYNNELFAATCDGDAAEMNCDALSPNRDFPELATTEKQTLQTRLDPRAC